MQLPIDNNLYGFLCHNTGLCWIRNVVSWNVWIVFISGMAVVYRISVALYVLRNTLTIVNCVNNIVVGSGILLFIQSINQ